MPKHRQTERSGPTSIAGLQTKFLRGSITPRRISLPTWAGENMQGGIVLSTRTVTPNRSALRRNPRKNGARSRYSEIGRYSFVRSPKTTGMEKLSRIV